MDQRKRYVHEVIGVNGRIDTIQAAVVDVKLKYFADEVQKREDIGSRYIDLLKGKQLKLPVIREEEQVFMLNLQYNLKEERN